MKVVLNVESLISSQPTGVAVYTRRLREELERSPQDVTLLFFADLHAELSPLQRTLGRAGRLPGVRTVLGAAADRAGKAMPTGDLYHDPNHILRPSEGPAAVTIHDLSLLHFPDTHPRERLEFFERHIESTLRRADAIIAVSAFAKRDICETLGVAPARVHVTPLGVGPEYRPLPERLQRQVMERLGLSSGRYLLALGAREPRKNLERLIVAHDRLPSKLRDACPLVIAGPRGWLSDRLEGRIDEMQRLGRVRRLGYVAESDKPALYSGAAGFAYPSLYEGFGLPPMEAAACGTPVLASRGTPAAEMLDGVALVTDPFDVDGMTEGLLRLLTDEPFRLAARTAGPMRTAAFTWERCAARTIAAYSAVLDGGEAEPALVKTTVRDFAAVSW